MPRRIAPEEMRVGGGEVVEEKFAAGEQIVGDLEFLEELLLREPAHAVLGAGKIAARAAAN